MLVMLSFGIFRTAVFAEPSVTKVEEMVGLVHWPGESVLPVAGCPASTRQDYRLVIVD